MPFKGAIQKWRRMLVNKLVVLDHFYIGGTDPENEVTATAAQLNAGAGSGTAAGTSIEDAGSRYAGENVEAALQEIAGAGRTTETVKSAYDLANGKYTKPGSGIPSTDMSAAVQAILAAVGGPVNITEGTPVNAVASSATLNVTGALINGEKFNIGDDTYEVASDVAQAVESGNIPVNIEPYTTKAQGTLTLGAQPSSGDTMTLGEKVYTFVPDGTATADGEISIGTDLPSAKLNVVAAINGADEYNDPHPLVSAAAFDSDDCIITALHGGTAGNSIASEETFNSGSNFFDAGTLGTTTSGADCSAANGVTAIVAAVTSGDTAGVGAVEGDGNTVVLSADVKGVAGDSIAISESLENAAFVGTPTTLENGVDGTVAADGGVMYYDASYLYISVAANTISGANWRQIALGSAY